MQALICVEVFGFWCVMQVDHLVPGGAGDGFDFDLAAPYIFRF